MPPKTSTFLSVLTNPSPEQAKAQNQAIGLQNEAICLGAQGNYSAAEARFLQAIYIRNQAFGEGNTHVAINQNSLGELYIKMGKYDRAEVVLTAALGLREQLKVDFDTAVTRENLAQVHEAKSDWLSAKSMRDRGLPDALVCGNSKCPGPLFTSKQLQRCARCKSPMYCTQVCQKADWTRHKQYCAKLAAARKATTENGALPAATEKASTERP